MASPEADYAAAASRILESLGASQAAAVQQRGQIWGQTLSNLGSLAANLPMQLNQAKELQMRQQLQQIQLDAYKQSQEAQARAKQIIAGLPQNPDGTYDAMGATKALAAGGAPLEELDRFGTFVDRFNQRVIAANTAKTDHMAGVADTLLSHHPKDAPWSNDELHLTFAAMRRVPAFGLTDQDEQQFVQMLAQPGADPQKVLETVRDQGTTFKAQKAKIAEEQAIPKFAPRESPGYMEGGTFHPLETPATKPNEWEMALRAAKGDPDALKAFQIVKGEKSGNEWAMFQSAYAKQTLGRPDATWEQLNPAQQVAGVTKFKTIGPEASAVAAADRQAVALGAQVAQQKRAQDFTEAQSGRREYTDKVSTPYQTALSSAATLRETVRAAQSGNKMAANLQNLETAMSAIRAQGLNRINTTEIHVAADAGNLWDRVQNAFGKITSGQPVDASLQKDILEFADILEKSATLKYQRQRKALIQTYPGANLPDESVTTGVVTPPAPKKNPFK